MPRTGIAMIVATLLGLGLAYPSSAERGVTDGEIVIGTSNALSGPSEFGGKQTNIGIKAYMDAINAEGGINGRKIKIISEDDKYEPDTAITSFQKLMAQNAFGITGAYGSTCLARYIPLSMNNKVPCVGHYAGTHYVGDPVKRYVFNARAAYKDEQHALVEKLWSVGLRKVAVIYQNDPYGVDQLDGIKEGLAKHGAQICAAGAYTRNSNNLEEAYNQVKQANPDVVILGAVYTPCIKAVTLAHQQKWFPIFVINSGSSEEAYIKGAGKDAEGTLITEICPAVDRGDLALIQKYKKALKQYYPDEKPGSVSLRGYIDAVVWGEGLKRAGKDVTREKFIDALESIHNLDVGLGRGMELSYSPTDHLGFHKIFFDIVKNGEVVEFTDWKGLKKKVNQPAE